MATGLVLDRNSRRPPPGLRPPKRRPGGTLCAGVGPHGSAPVPLVYGNRIDLSQIGISNRLSGFPLCGHADKPCCQAFRPQSKCCKTNRTMNLRAAEGSVQTNNREREWWPERLNMSPPPDMLVISLCRDAMP